MDAEGETFFDQLLECAKSYGEKHPGAVAPETMRELCAPAERPGFVRPRPFRPATEPEPPAPTPAGTAVAPDAPPEVKLEKMRIFAQSCKRCQLAATRTNVVFGAGDPHAELMFIGEGPGADEDRTGRPFVGKAGQLLDKMIAAMHFTRQEVYIANVVKCRPPGNRVPTPDEAAMCIGYLERQIKFIRPKVIVLLGATAVSFLLQRKEGITKLRGNWQDYRGFPVMPTFHPAFLLRQESAKREAWHDLKLVMAKFGKTP